MKIFLLTILFIVFPLATIHAHDLSRDPQWIKLGHYIKTTFGGYESEADGQKFFLASNGKRNPHAELEKTIEVFNQIKNSDIFNDEHVLCRFPARYMWLQKTHPDYQLDPTKVCPGLLQFTEKLAAKSLSLIFSSYYINTPASAFGHTLLRFNRTSHKKDQRQDSDLLDYGINYAAIVDTDNALVYGVKGFTGMFPGKFSAIPYYYKLREYNDYESRDLWEYQLDFNQQQIDLMVAHLWELGHTHFDYYYLTENCSYHLLSLLEVGNPKLRLRERLPFYVIPIDTVRATEKEGIVLGRIYRPSILTKIQLETEELSFDDKELVSIIAKNPEQTPLLLSHMKDPAQRAKLLDIAVDVFDFFNSSDLAFNKNGKADERHKLLVARSEIEKITQEKEWRPGLNQWPDSAHPSHRAGINLGHKESSGQYTQLSMRFALHDILDPLKGEPSFSELSFFDTALRIQDNDKTNVKKLYLDRWDLFKVSSFEPITHWYKSPSWTAKMGMKTIQDRGCEECLAGTVEVGGGGTLGFKGTPNFVSFLMRGDLDYSTKFQYNFRALVGPELMYRYVPNNNFAALLSVGYRWSNSFTVSEWSRPLFTPSLEIRYHGLKKSSIYLKARQLDKERSDVSAGLYVFF